MKRFLIAAGLGLALTSYGDTLARTNWFDSSGLLIATTGHLQTTFTNQQQFWTTYFAPTNTPVTLSQPGNQIRLTWTFTPKNILTLNTETPMAIALLFTPDANRLTNDAAPGDAAYGGYTTFMGAYAGSLFRIVDLAGRTDASSPSALFRPDYPGRIGWTVQAANYNNGVPSGQTYTLTMTLIRNTDGGLDVSTIIAGSNLISQCSFTDPAPASFSFNTACIYGDGSLTGSIDTTGFDIEFFPTSPPALDFQPASLACFPGNRVTFSPAVTGSLPLSYHWTFNTIKINGETNASLTLTNVQFGQSGNYAMVVTNQAGSITSSNAMLTVRPPPPCVPPPAGLVAWWPGDGNALDIIGGNNGTLLNGVSYENGQQGGQCFSFNGGNAAVHIGNATNLQLQDFTIETWVQRASTFISSPNGGPGLLFSFGGGGYGFGINDGGTLLLSKIGEDAITSSGGIADTGWHHVAVTKSATNVVFFIDSNAGAVLAYTNQFQFSTPACIGAMGNNSGFPPASFYGAIDELSI
ncbi:MAG: LamG domain protein jellyroll fold domain protein, partial [Pedosphaera sp.]|nr:LamG domain protein jellyroll fold domain protein [Pedosphaera sp.]